MSSYGAKGTGTPNRSLKADVPDAGFANNGLVCPTCSFDPAARLPATRTLKGTVHEFSNPFSEPARALIMLSPDIGARYFLDISKVISTGAPPDKAALIAIMKRYGLVPSAPAGA